MRLCRDVRASSLMSSLWILSFVLIWIRYSSWEVIICSIQPTLKDSWRSRRMFEALMAEKEANNVMSQKLDLMVESLLGEETWGLKATFDGLVKPRQDLRVSKLLYETTTRCFLWTITLYHSTLSPMPTDRPVPVSIHLSSPLYILFSFPSILRA